MSNWGGVKRRPADILFSKYLRKEHNYTCDVCHTRHEPNSKNLGVSHFWPRSYESTRFDERQDVLCNIPCHQYFEEHRMEYEAWKLERMGKQEYNKFMLEAHIPKKKDDAKILLWLKNIKK